jgi:hypothetical protein
MKTFRFPDCRAYTFKPPHPEKTTQKDAPGLGVDRTFREYPSRAVMAKHLRALERKPQYGASFEVPCVPLEYSEGY